MKNFKMHKVNRNCPICKQNGKNTPLELRQINLTEAVYICEDRNCIYPIGFQWEYVENNILEDSDESSDDSIEPLKNNHKISSISIPQLNTCNNKKLLNTNSSNNLLFEKYKKITNQSNTTSDSKGKFNIISNIKTENPRHLRSTIKKDNIKTNEIFTKPTESIRKNNLRFSNKTKSTQVSGALPESVVENAKALSEYFSSTPNKTRKSKRTIKTVFDIIQQTPVQKQEVSTKNKSDEVLTEEAKKLIIKNTSIDHSYTIKKVDEDINDSKYIDSFLENSIKQQVKEDTALTACFDELLFSNDDKCDVKNQSLDLSEMDELLSFL